MADSVLKVCRVCLEQLGENEHFHFLKNDNGSMLLSKLLDSLPEIDLDFVKNPISCNQCTITIDQLYDFKKLCMQTESVLSELKQQRKSFNDAITFVENEPEIEVLKEEFLKDEFKNEYTTSMTESVAKICRICREQLSENEHFHFINNDDGLMLLSKLLLDFLPEIDLDFMQNPISCNQCTVTIDRIHEFKKLCMQTEIFIKDLKMQGKPFEDVISYVNKDTEIEMIKEEFKDEPEIVSDVCLQINTDLPVCVEVPSVLLFYCYTCNYTTFSKRNLSQHMNIHRLQVKRFKCYQCSYTTRQKCHLKVHIRKHITKKPYKCDVCDYRSNHQTNLKMHIRTHTGEKPYQCDVCDYRCNQQTNLITHIRTHTGEKPFKCDVCSYCCNQQLVLKRHIHTHTGEKPYECDICDYRSILKSHLKAHIRKHTGEKPYKCDVCDYRSDRQMNLKTHIRTHTGEKPYKCDVCDYRCSHQSRLQIHINTHNRELTYKCDFCNYRCKVKSYLQKHILTHTGEKPYQCDLCDYHCNRKAHLQKHILTHSGEKPYKCDVCDYHCKVKSYLKRHIQTHQ